MTIWWHKHNKVIHLQYCKEWEKPMYKVYTNGAKRKNGDSCFDFNIHFGRFAFWYTNYDLQRKIKGEKIMNKEELEKEAIAKYKTGSYPQIHPDHWAFKHGYLAGAEPREKRTAELEKQLTEAKDLIRNLLRVTYGEGWNYSLDWKVKAEQFLKELDK